MEKQDPKESRENKVMRETQETKGMLVRQENLDLKERLVTPASLADEVQREAEASLASRGRLAHLDLGACRGTGVYLESEGPRVLRVKSQVISTSSKFACESCKNSWPS